MQQRWEREFALKEQQFELERLAAHRARWFHPLVLAVIGAAVAAASNAYVAWFNGKEQRDLEEHRADETRKVESLKAEHARLLQVLRTNNADEAAQNLDFLLKVGLIFDQAIAPKLRTYLENRVKGTGPVLPAVPVYDTGNWSTTSGGNYGGYTVGK